MVRRAAAVLAIAACNPDALVIAPIIDSPPAGSDAAAFPDLDEIELSIARAGDVRDLVSATFERGDTLELADVPYGDDLVIHMIGRVGGAEVAAGRTCAFTVAAGQPAPAPHLYFARTVKWADAAIAPSPVRIAGAAVTAGDGSALYIGGLGAAGEQIVGLDRFDPRQGAFAQLAAVSDRAGARVARLDRGAVIVGGAEPAGLAGYIELVTTDAAPGRRVERFEAPAVAATELTLAELSDGRAVAIGGRDATLAPLGTVVLITPEGSGLATRVVQSTLAVPRAGHTATRLSGDLGAPVLVTGGLDALGAPVAGAELWKPLLEVFADPMTFARAMLVPRTGHVAARLPDGSVLILGGRNAAGAPERQVELFSLDAGFVSLGLMPAGAGLTEQSATALPDGRILIAGGRDELGSPVDTVFIARLDIVDGVPDLVATDRLTTPRAGHQAALLCDGTVLVVGGTTAATPAERYNPPALGRR